MCKVSIQQCKTLAKFLSDVAPVCRSKVELIQLGLAHEKKASERGLTYLI